MWDDCNTMPYGRCKGRIRVRWSRLLSLDDLASPFQVSTCISVLFADVEFRIHFQERFWCQKICYEASHVTKLPFSGDWHLLWLPGMTPRLATGHWLTWAYLTRPTPRPQMLKGDSGSAQNFEQDSIKIGRFVFPLYFIFVTTWSGNVKGLQINIKAWIR